MGKELPLARKKKFRPSVLLASARSGELASSPSHRDSGQEETVTTKRKEKGKTADTVSESKTSPEAEVPNGGSSKRRRGRQGDSNRESDRGTKGTDSICRRSAKDMGVEFPGSYCPSGEAHYFAEVDGVDRGILFRCIRCYKHLWLPNRYDEAEMLSNLARKYGLAGGYLVYLNSHTVAKIMIAKLQDLWYARKRVTDDEQFAKLVVSVMDDRDYGREK